MAHFNRERIPERVVHAKGAGWSFVIATSISRKLTGFSPKGLQGNSPGNLFLCT